MLTALAFFLLSCSPPPEEAPTAGDAARPELVPYEVAFPGETGTPGVAMWGDRAVPYLQIGEYAVAEGDILLPLRVDPRAPPSAGRYFTNYRWEGGVIPYAFDPSITITAYLDALTAIDHWNTNTSFTLIPRTVEADYVNFVDSTGCASYIGRIGGAQEIWLAINCGSGAAIHELGHAIGLWHEQARADAGDYVVFNEANLADPTLAYNFETYVVNEADGTDLGPYDYTSIMQYPSYAFAINGYDCVLLNVGCTLNKADGSYISEYQRTALSTGDIWGAHRMYFDTWQVAAGGTGVWEEWRVTTDELVSPKIADIDGDGLDDVARLAGASIEIWWGGTSTSTIVAPPVATTTFAVADTDGDGAFELVISDGTRWRRWRASTGTWGTWMTRSASVAYYTFVDLNGDGRTDTLRETGTTWLVWWSGIGVPTTLTGMPAPADARFPDLDGDGAADIVIESGGAWLGRTSATGVWTTLLTGAPSLASTFAADLDGDGIDALVYLDGTAAQTLVAGALGAAWTLDTEGGVVRVGDFDGDGADDVLTAMAPRQYDPGADGIYSVPEEFASVQAAVDAAASQGGIHEVAVAAGTWAAPFSLPVDVTVVGAGEDLTTLEGGAIWMDAGSRLADLTVQHTGNTGALAVWGDNAVIERVTLVPTGAYTALSVSDDLTAVDLRILAGATDGVVVAVGAALTATGLVIEEVTDDGIFVDGSATLDGARIVAADLGLWVTSSSSTTCTNCFIDAATKGVDVNNDAALSLVNTTVFAPLGVDTSSTVPVTLVNTVFLEATTEAVDCGVAGSILFTNTYANTTSSGCATAPLLTVSPDVDADGHLGPASDLVDVGTTVAGLVTDRDGDTRPLDGDGDGTPEFDVGCDERVP